MSERAKGALIIVGGAEEKEDEPEILSEIAARADGGRLVVVTAATRHPDEVAATYRDAFATCGLKKVAVIDIRTREQANDPKLLAELDGATVVFFTGGDQLRITSQVGGTPLFERMLAIYRGGGVIAGTSAGAAAMPAAMLIAGPSDSSQALGAISMAPGLGLLDGVVIDTHFAERGRIGRILGTVARNPTVLGIGIDEDTALVVERGVAARVIGCGAVYLVDGTSIAYTSLSEQRPDGVVTIHGATLHVLGAGDRFDLAARRPVVEGQGR